MITSDVGTDSLSAVAQTISDLEPVSMEESHRMLTQAKNQGYVPFFKEMDYSSSRTQGYILTDSNKQPRPHPTLDYHASEEVSPVTIRLMLTR